LRQVGLFWAGYFRTIYIPEIDTFAQCLVDRILPTFNNLEDEAKEIEEAENERLSALSCPDDDGAVIAEKAFEAGLDHFVRMRNMRQGILNMFCSGLYHLFEQLLINFYRLEIFGIGREVEHNLSIKGVKQDFLEKTGLDLGLIGDWQLIDELRLIANTVKHADGDSSLALKEKKPNAFVNPALAGFPTLRRKPGPVFKPMFGEDLYVKIEDFSLYVETVKRFWLELANLIESNYKY